MSGKTVISMKIQVYNSTIQLVQGDITKQSVDAIVNAANSALAGGGGVDGAIHDAAGPLIIEETAQKYPEGCPTGEAVITAAGDLTAKFIIHTVGPVWGGGVRGEADLLKNAYSNSLKLAVEHHCESVAFPAISTGVYGYPIDLAAKQSLRSVADFLREHESSLRVSFVLFDNGSFGAYSNALEELSKMSTDW